jgi:predicted metal-dependent enzyme (double-stranded beta helix superfamily)
VELVIGQYHGEEEESRFRITNNRLERVGVVVARPGDVSHVYPPSRDIHKIINRTARPTISIHIYGGDLGSQRRHTYDPDSAAMQEFISGTISLNQSDSSRDNCLRYSVDTSS